MSPQPCSLAIHWRPRTTVPLILENPAPRQHPHPFTTTFRGWKHFLLIELLARLLVMLLAWFLTKFLAGFRVELPASLLPGFQVKFLVELLAWFQPNLIAVFPVELQVRFPVKLPV